MNEGFVYIVRFEDLKMTKIGFSNNPYMRIKELLCSEIVPVLEKQYKEMHNDDGFYGALNFQVLRFEIYGIFEVNNKNFEFDLHKYFKDKKTNYKKEYFDINEEDIKIMLNDDKFFEKNKILSFVEHIRGKLSLPGTFSFGSWYRYDLIDCMEFVRKGVLLRDKILNTNK